MDKRSSLRIVSLIVAVIIFVTNVKVNCYAFNSNLFSYVNNDEIKKEADNDINEKIEISDGEIYEISNDSDGFVSINASDKPLNTGKNTRIRTNHLNAYCSNFNQSISVSYNSLSQNKVTPVKNQGGYPSCWAFSTIGAIECSLLYGSDRLDNEELNLSETSLLYDFYHREGLNDPLGNTGGDYTYAKKDVWYRNMGNQQLASWALLNWECTFDEHKANDYSDITNYIGDSDNYFNSDYHVQDVVFFEEYNNITKKSTSDCHISPECEKAMKEFIMQEGSLSIGIKSSSAYKNETDSTYVYAPNKESANHAVLIVGWDDTVDRYNFAKKGSAGEVPSRDGAWLVKNSYGSSYGKANGVGGYFWLSYDDETISSITGFNAEESNNFNHIFYYDGGSALKSLKISKNDTIYNIFKNTTDKTQKISGAGIGIKTASVEGIDYTLNIYKNPDPGNKSLGEKMLKEPIRDTLHFSGYHTDKLSEEITVAPGETFSVAYTFMEDVWAYIDMKNDNASWYGVRVGEKKGEGYSYKNYYDLSTYDSGPITLRIKAYTDDVNDNSSKSDQGNDKSQKDSDNTGSDSADSNNTDSDKKDNDINKDENPDNIVPSDVDNKENMKEDHGDISDADYEEYCKNGIPTSIWVAGLNNCEALIYDGIPKEPEIRVYNNNHLLIKNTDYSLTYKNNINAYKADLTDKAPKVVIRFIGKYQGIITKTFSIGQRKLTNEEFIFKDKIKKYTGKTVKYVPSIYDSDGKKLKPNKDYRFSIYKISDEASLNNIYNPVKTEDLIEAGVYEIKAAGIGNYYGDINASLIISDDRTEVTDINKIKITGLDKKVLYTGREIIQDKIKLSYKGKEISKEAYEICYINNIMPGKAAIMIKGLGGNEGVYGTKILNFKILGKNIKKCSVNFDKKFNYNYNGKFIEPDVHISDEGKSLSENRDYTITYKNNINAGKGRIIIAGINEYSGMVNKAFRIDKCDISETNIEWGRNVSEKKSYKKRLTTWVTVSDNSGKFLSEGRDYVLRFRNTKNSNYVIIKGIGNYTGIIGKKQKLFSFDKYEEDINKISLNKAVCSIREKEYNSDSTKLLDDDIDILIDGYRLKLNSDYKIVGYSMNTKPGKAWVYLEGIGNYTGIYKYKFKIKKKNIS